MDSVEGEGVRDGGDNWSGEGTSNLPGAGNCLLFLSLRDTHGVP